MSTPTKPPTPPPTPKLSDCDRILIHPAFAVVPVLVAWLLMAIFVPSLFWFLIRWYKFILIIQIIAAGYVYYALEKHGNEGIRRGWDTQASPHGPHMASPQPKMTTPAPLTTQDVDDLDLAIPPPPMNAPALRRHLSIFDRVTVTTVNPFINPTWHISQQERIRLSITAVTLFPIRVVCICVLLTIAYICASIAMYGVTLEQKKYPMHPLTGWRRLFVLPIAYLTRILMFCLGYYYVDWKGGKPVNRKSAPIVVCNHVCPIDPFYMLYIYLPSPVAAVENLTAPILGPIVAALQTITVDRTNETSRNAVLNAIKTRAIDPQDWSQILIFPEATTTNSLSIINFKPGAFAPGVPVQPVVVKYPNKRGAFHPCWVPAGPGLAMLMFRQMCEPTSFMEVEFLPPYHPNEAERADPALYAQNVRMAMSKAMNVPATHHTYDDMVLQNMAFQVLKQPPNLSTTDASQLKSAFALDIKGMKSYLTRFQQMDTSKSGYVNYQQFRTALGWDDSQETRHLFRLIDVDDNGYINFQEYLVGLAAINSTNPKDLIRFAFTIFDVDDDGKIPLSDLKNVYRRVYPTLTESELAAAFAPLDSLGESSIGLEAFTTFATSNPAYIKQFAQTMGRAYTMTPRNNQLS